MRARNSRPGVGTRAAQSVSVADLNGTSSIAPAADKHTPRKDVFALSLRRDFYVRVHWQRRDGVLCANVYADLRSAERKAGRVRAKGLAARLELLRVVAVMPLDDDREGGGARG